jgi:hypothetical protein
VDLLIELKNLIEVFDNNKIDYALCGGLALAVYARPRATLDIDIMVEPDLPAFAESRQLQLAGLHSRPP